MLSLTAAAYLVLITTKGSILLSQRKGAFHHILKMWQLLPLLAAALSAADGNLFPSKASNCPLGWVDDGNLGCFLFAPQMAGLSWLEALQFCEEQVFCFYEICKELL